MIKTTMTIMAALVIGGLLAAAASAGPITLNSDQMDGVAAGGHHKVDGFVCPVIKTDAVLNSPNGMAIGEGHYTIIGPNVSIPTNATNTLPDGTAGTPPGPHAAPGDKNTVRGYTAIWRK